MVSILYSTESTSPVLGSSAPSDLKAARYDVGGLFVNSESDSHLEDSTNKRVISSEGPVDSQEGGGFGYNCVIA